MFVLETKKLPSTLKYVVFQRWVGISATEKNHLESLQTFSLAKQGGKGDQQRQHQYSQNRDTDELLGQEGVSS